MGVKGLKVLRSILLRPKATKDEKLMFQFYRIIAPAIETRALRLSTFDLFMRLPKPARGTALRYSTPLTPCSPWFNFFICISLRSRPEARLSSITAHSARFILLIYARKSFDFLPIDLRCSVFLEECFKFSIRLFEGDFFLYPWKVAVPGRDGYVGPALIETEEEPIFHI